MVLLLLFWPTRHAGDSSQARRSERDPQPPSRAQSLDHWAARRSPPASHGRLAARPWAGRTLQADPPPPLSSPSAGFRDIGLEGPFFPDFPRFEGQFCECCSRWRLSGCPAGWQPPGQPPLDFLSRVCGRATLLLTPWRKWVQRRAGVKLNGGDSGHPWSSSSLGGWHCPISCRGI